MVDLIPTNRVSVITPCYNQGAYIGECLESLIAQTYPNWECLIMDDGSTDDSQQIARHYADQDARIRWATQPNQGPSAARNHAIALTEGEFILPLDADDCIDSTYLAKAVELLVSRPEIKLVYSRCQMFGSREGEMELRKYSFTELMRGNIITNTAMYRRSDFLKSPGYDVKMRVGWEDWEFYLSLLSPEDEIFQIDEPLFLYRQKPGSRDNSINPEQARELRRYIFQKHAETYRDYFEDPINLAYQVKILQREVRRLEKKDIVGRVKRRLYLFFGKQK